MAGILDGLGNVFGALGGAFGAQQAGGGTWPGPGLTAADYNGYWNATTASANSFITINTSHQQPAAPQEKPPADPEREWLRRRVDEICWRA